MTTERRAGLVLLFGAAALVLSALAWIRVWGVTLDGARWRGAIETRAAAALGRPVGIAGPIAISIGRELAIELRQVSIANPEGMPAGPFATLGTLSARIGTRDALAGTLHLRQIEAGDVRIALARSADGRNNWTFGAGGGDAGSASIAIDTLGVRDLTLDLADAGAPPTRLLAASRIEARARHGEAVGLSARARIRDAADCDADFTGGTLQALQAGDGPWPVRVLLACPATRLHAQGTIAPQTAAAQLDVGIGTARLAEAAALLGADATMDVAASLAVRASLRRDAIELADLRGIVDDTGFAGTLAIATEAARPRITGAVVIPVLDVRPRPQPPAATAATDWTARAVSLRNAPAFDADVALRIGAVTGLAIDVRDARIDVRVTERGVRAPLAATVAAIPVMGTLEADLAAPVPAFTLDVGATDAELAALAQAWPGAAGVEGRIGRIELHAAGRGETLGALADALDARLDVADARLRYGAYSGGRPVALTVQTFEARIPPGKALHGKARGSLRGEPMRVTFSGPTLAQVVEGAALPIRAEARSAGAVAAISSTVEAAEPVDLAFRLDARRAGSLARWLPISPDAAMPLAVSGRARSIPGGWQVSDGRVAAGSSRLSLEATRTVRNGRPLTVASIRGELIDIDELATLGGTRTREGPRTRAAMLDLDVLPEGIDLADADVDAELDRVRSGRLEIEALRVRASMRDGRLQRSPVAAAFAGMALEGGVSADLRSATPEFALALASRDVDIGRLLRALGVAEIVEGTAGELDLDFAATGASVRELLESAALDARLRGGEIALRGPVGLLRAVRLEDLAVGAARGQPVTARVAGAMDGEPVRLDLRTGTLLALAQAESRVPIRLQGETAGTRLVLDGNADLPLGRGGEVELLLEGTRLDSLSTLARAGLPHWGPWSVRGPIAMRPDGYALTALTARVGSSVLEGVARLDLSGERPRLSASVTAPMIQIDDFPLEPRPAGAGDAAGVQNTLRATARGAADQTQQALDIALLQRLDATVDVTAAEVRSGSDVLGDGRMRMTLDAGRLAIAPVLVNLPGGSLWARANYDATGPLVLTEIVAEMDRFDYGVLMRRIRPDTNASGTISLDVFLRGNARSLTEMPANATGRFDVAIWPRDLGGGVLDRWSINAFNALLPFLDRSPVSQVNCFVARFDLQDGLATVDAMLVDTTRVRATGTGHANFVTEEVSFRFSPRGKGLAIGSLQTPLRLEGTMTDFRIFAAPGDVFEAIARVFTSFVTVPLQTLFRGGMPRDGADVCDAPMRPR
jgi:uncharacterized protein involved in outer membrane biogenesis